MARLFGVTGMRSPEIKGDVSPPSQFTNGPQFYIRESNISAADVRITGVGALYLDRGSVASVTVDGARNSLSLWGPARVTGSIDMGGGSDTLLGGAGMDTAVFTGGRRDFDVTRTGDTVTIRDLRANADGTDTLTGIEQVQFADG